MRAARATVALLLLLAGALSGCITLEPPSRTVELPPAQLEHPGIEGPHMPRLPTAPVFPAIPEIQHVPLREHWSTFGETGASMPAGLWSEAAASHPVDISLTSPSLLLVGGFTIPEDGHIHLAPRASPVALQSGPRALVLDGATWNGETGLILIEGDHTVSITGPLTGNRSVGSLLALGGEIRSPLETELGFHTPQAPLTLPAPFNETALRRYALQLPAHFTLAAPQARFLHADGNETPLPGVTTNLSAEHILSAGGMFLEGGHDRVHAGPLDVTPSDVLHLQGYGADGTIRIRNTTHDLPGAPLSASLRAPGAFTLQPNGRIPLLTGDAFDLQAGGHPRLGAAVAVAPNVLDLNGEPGQVIEFHVLLIEGSGGANAHLGGHTLTANTTLELAYARSEAFQITPQLQEWLHDIADFTAEHPITAPVTIPLMVGIGISMPFAMLLDALSGLASLFSPPELTGTIPAGEALRATFRVEIPEHETEATLTIHGHNFPAQDVTLRLVPDTGADA